MDRQKTQPQKNRQETNNILKRSNSRKKNPEVWSFICPLCCTPRWVPFSPKTGNLKHLAQIGSTSAFFCLLTWPWFGWKGIVCFLPFWTLFEIIYRWRRRAALTCRKCGFDPYLYRIDPDWAKREIHSHWKKKFEEKGIPFPEKNPKAPQATTGAIQNPP